MNDKVIKWGFIGCGSVTQHKSGPAFKEIESSEVVAIMSRHLGKAEDYARSRGITKWYDDAQSLINDPEVNAVYIATPPSSHDRFKQAGLTAILGCGFDPGVSGVYTAYAAKHYFDKVEYLDIVDCNAGNHHKAFATNFNPEINIREITQKGRYYQDGKWIQTEPLEVHKPLNYPNIGPKDSYLLYHEELESLVKHYPTIKRARFWMTFGQEYITHLRVIQDIGMARIDPVMPLKARKKENIFVRRLVLLPQDKVLK